jgi:hypothetical protein
MDPKLTPDLVKDQIGLVDLLTKLGYKSIRASGKELFYISMIRDDDTTPSFCVNSMLNVWYDHGLGVGGSVIDFGKAFWPGIPFRQMLIKLWETADKDPSDLPKMPRPRRTEKLPHYTIETVKEIGHTEAIKKYLLHRGIFEVAQGLLKEVHYQVEIEPGQTKPFFAAGHQNELGGWEVRNKFFKSCLGKKGLTIIKANERQLCVFEGYFDFLSWKHEYPDKDSSILVLNSLSLIQGAIKVATYYPKIEIYFDHDKAGTAASGQWIKALPYSIDRAANYEGYIDYNDKLRAHAKARRQLENNKRKGIFDGVEVPFER